MQTAESAMCNIARPSVCHKCCYNFDVMLTHFRYLTS